MPTFVNPTQTGPLILPLGENSAEAARQAGLAKEAADSIGDTTDAANTATSSLYSLALSSAQMGTRGSAFTAVLPDGTPIRMAWTGAANRPVAGVDDRSRLFALTGFHVPMGGTVGAARSNYAWGVGGRRNQPVVGVDWAGGFFAQRARFYGRAEFSSGMRVGAAQVSGRDANYSWAVAGASGRPLIGVRNGDVYLARAGSSTRISMLYADGANMARGRAIATTPHNVPIARITNKAVNLCVGLGQSLMSSYEGWPYLPRAAEPCTYMMGSSIRPATFQQPGWTCQGAAALNPLQSTVEQLVDSGRAPLSDAAIAALTPGDGPEGESMLTGAVRQLARGYVDQRGDTSRSFVAANAAVGGRTLEQLSKGASPNLYTRGTEALSTLAGIVDPAGTTHNYQVLAALFAQGEWNYVPDYGGTQDYSAYLAKLIAYRTAYNADWAAVSGQAEAPAWLTYVTSAGYVNDACNMSISNAQVDFALSTPGVWCFGAAYPVPDKGGHLHSNGYRWMSAMAGKVLRKVLVERQGFEPLTPIKIEAIGRTVYVHFATATPLQFKPCYVVEAPTMFDGRGFRLTDDAGAPNITAIGIVGGSIVAIDLDRALSTNPYVWYASQATSGSGNLCNSDPARSDDIFSFLTSLPGNPGGSGMYPGENIAALVNQPYPLWDWCVPFRRPVGYSR